MNCSKLILATALLIGAGAYAKPVVIGEPSKGTPVTTIRDGKKKVEITTTGISVDEGDDSKDSDDEKETTSAATIKADKDGNVEIAKTPMINIRAEGKTEQLEDIVVPVAFFAFILAAILGAKYISSRNEQKRLELLKLMVEKGQPVPDSVVNSILTPQSAPESDDNRQTYKRYRNAYGFTIAGFLMMSYGMLTHNLDGGSMICGLIFLCIGAGGLAGLYLPKRTSGNSEKV